jgi:DNA-binding IclR family transcriptional regulator
VSTAGAGRGQRGGGVESVLRALRLLDCFERGRPEMSLGDLVRCAGYSKTTTYRLLLTLEEAGWLERSEGAGFRLTIKPFLVGSILVDSLELRREAGPVMATLVARTDRTAYLTVPSGTRAVCLERVDGSHPLRIADLHVGGAQPLHLGAGPRALLAFREAELLPALLSEGLVGRTPTSLVHQEALVADLAASRDRGYTVSDEDVTPEVAALGMPVLGASGRAVAALSIGGLKSALLPPRPEHLEHLRHACEALSRRLGHR